MEYYYSTDRNSQMIISLLKAHGIKTVVASPGTTNISLVASMQHDGSFNMYSCVDERSAAYMACGLAAQSEEPAVIICTEATASRNYYPGLTEAYHRKLPILAITGLHNYCDVGHLEPQVIDRSASPHDSVRLKVNLPVLKDKNDVRESELKINQAILELKRHGGGPVHINLPVSYKPYYFIEKKLPPVRVIKRFFSYDKLPKLPEGKKAVFIGSHKKWSKEETQALELFCERFNAVAFCSHSSRYYGGYRVNSFLLANQAGSSAVFENIALVIHIGEETSDLPTLRKLKTAKQTWRVSEDGELRDSFKNLTNVFEMREQDFFRYYTGEYEGANADNTFFNTCRAEIQNLNAMAKDVPLSNIYAASVLTPLLPEKSMVFFGASNTMRAWSMFDLPQAVESDSNMGCRGIDGTLSSAVGFSLADKNRLCFCILGDLSFFYDMNVLGVRHIRPNLRILLINNGGGSLLKQNGAPGYRIGEENCNLYIAAGGHYGNKSPDLVRCYSESLGFEYMCASNKEEFNRVYSRFVDKKPAEKPMLFEVFTDDTFEREAFDTMKNLIKDPSTVLKQHAKTILGEEGKKLVGSIVRKLK